MNISNQIKNTLGPIVGIGSAQAGAAAQASAMAPGGYRPPTMADNIASHRRSLASKDKVLEYFQAQLNMDLFKGDIMATMYFQKALDAAFEQVKKL